MPQFASPKKLALATVCSLLSATAFAQTNVILYGVVDAGVEYANHQSGNGSSVVRLSSGNIAGSRWGMRGTEDFGQGLRGVFVLESGYDVDTGKSGQGGRLFGRQAYVGLQGTWGSLLLGRQQSAMYDFIGNFEPMALATKYSVFTQDPIYIQRADNTVKYVGTFGGLAASAFYSFGADSNIAGGSEVPGNPKLGREFGGYVTYATGPFALAIAYDQLNTGTVSVTPDATARRVSTAATYATGPAKFFAGYRWARAYDGGVIPGAAPGAANQGSNLYWLGASWQATPALGLSVAAYYQDFKNTGSDPWLFAANADYAFSKRTRAYLSVGYTKNKGNSNLGFFDAGKSFGNTNPGQNQTGAVIGLRHSF
ncbi:porin [Cupriavidus pinatubonensis]|uniref:Outer membrane porin protein n=1 Tax=Cupriavidus pinatubonensis TaxID=248026 RepID=A0ABN7ZFB8_9BURK|nr:porin [Cupriavidus pinatubonensis]CAG9183396.1 Outer membrane porin protein [Cupriavidus pinatubonensis]